MLKLLVSVYQLVHTGNRVAFDSVDNGGSYIEQWATGRRTKVDEEGGSFVFPLKMRKGKPKPVEQGFVRQVAVIRETAEVL